MLIIKEEIMAGFRLIIMLCSMLSCIYGCAVSFRKNKNDYFKIMLCGSFGLFLVWLFFVVLTFSNGNDTIFSVGVFGYLATFLFFHIANTAYIPGEEKRRFSLPAFLIACITAAIAVWTVLNYTTLVDRISEALYLVAIPLTVYSCVKALLMGRSNDFCRHMTGGNLCILIIAFCSMLYELLLSMDAVYSGAFVIILLLISCPARLLIMPLFERGLRRWTA